MRFSEARHIGDVRAADAPRMLSVLAAVAFLVFQPSIPDADAQAAASPTLEPVTAGADAAGPGADPDRVLPADLRADTGFERVYRVKTTDGRDLFARVDGGLIAFFPRGEYASTVSGAVPVVPAGTVFSIGRPTEALAARLGIDLGDSAGSVARTPAQGRLLRRVDTRADVARPGATTTTAPRPAPAEPAAEPAAEQAPTQQRNSEPATPWGDERTRADRLSRLLADAVAASATTRFVSVPTE